MSILKDSLSELMLKYGNDAVLKEVQNVYKSINENDICTIIVNEGLHNFPSELIVGDVYVFSVGMLDFSSKEKLNDQISMYVRQLINFLKRKKWRKIYTIISGHAALNMYVKLTVYRSTRIETIDWAFDGNGHYFELDIPVKLTTTDV